jgi:peptidoglycan hydrolase-like protein with peptidoglycan-binding domain
MNNDSNRYRVPVPVDISKVYENLPEPAGPAVVGNDRTDQVRLDSCIYKNIHARKSLTIHHLQRRLAELGYTEASYDKDGWYGDYTKNAIISFQSNNGFTPNGIVDAATFLAIFDGDVNVTTIV